MAGVAVFGGRLYPTEVVFRLNNHHEKLMLHDLK